MIVSKISKKKMDFGFRQEFYSNDKLYFVFSANGFDESSDIVLDNIIILENNRENSFLNIKIGDYNLSAKATLKDNNYKEVKPEIQNIEKYVNLEEMIALELWIDNNKIYRIVVKQLNSEEVNNVELNNSL